MNPESFFPAISLVGARRTGLVVASPTYPLLGETLEAIVARVPIVAR
jgi:hypothetical protein